MTVNENDKVYENKHQQLQRKLYQNIKGQYEKNRRFSVLNSSLINYAV